MKTNSKQVELELNLPGFGRDDIKIKLGKNSLNVTADKKMSNEIKRKDFFHKEFSSRSFNYSSTLPLIDPKKSKVSYKNGILKIKAERK